MSLDDKDTFVTELDGLIKGVLHYYRRVVISKMRLI